MTRIVLAEVAAWLHLAAAPSFAVTALLAAIAGDAPDMLCGGHAAPLGGMMPMRVPRSALAEARRFARPHVPLRCAEHFLM